MKLYTKSGDHGITSLVGGKRVPKTDIRICACGDIDELNAHIGLLHSMTGDKFAPLLTSIQSCLFHLGTALSTLSEGSIKPEDITTLEHEIDRLQDSTPQPGTFVLPGGSMSAAQSHVCRTVCRRAERSVVELSSHYAIAPSILEYLNRLSDYFFILALNLNFIEGIAEKKLYIPCK